MWGSLSSIACHLRSPPLSIINMYVYIYIHVNVSENIHPYPSSSNSKHLILSVTCINQNNSIIIYHWQAFSFMFLQIKDDNFLLLPVQFYFFFGHFISGELYTCGAPKLWKSQVILHISASIVPFYLLSCHFFIVQGDYPKYIILLSFRYILIF